LLAKAGAVAEEMLFATVDPGTLDDVRTHWPYFRDRRIDAYGDLTKRFLV
jgi:N-carbamoylputrescine amidase